MNFEEKWDYIREINEKILNPDGFEEALVGFVERFGMDALPVYDRDKCLEILVKRDRMTYEEAEEFFEFNVIGAWVGDGTPAFVTLFKD